MKYSFHEAAEKELFAAIEYYEESQPGLGLKFSEEVYASIERICDHPYAWTAIDSKTRRCLTSRFPFGILYRVHDEQEIYILAINASSQKTGLLEKQINTTPVNLCAYSALVAWQARPFLFLSNLYGG